MSRAALARFLEGGSVVQSRLFDFSNIPAELRNLKQWAVWKLTERENKNGSKNVSKPPLQPNGEEAKPNDSSTWVSFDEAVKASPNFDGVSFCLTADSGLVGLDLDNCRDPVSGVTEDWAKEILEQVDSYSEISPTGTGWHIFAKGELPRGGNRRGSVEMYSNGRFFAMTGNTQDGIGSKEIEERDGAIFDVHSFMMRGDYP